MILTGSITQLQIFVSPDEIEYFQDLLEIVSFLVLNKTSDTSLVKDYCEWFEKMKILIGEMTRLTVHGETGQRELMKIVSQQSIDPNSASCSSLAEVLRRTVEIKANLGPVEVKGTDLISSLLQAAALLRDGDQVRLSECLNRETVPAST